MSGDGSSASPRSNLNGSEPRVAAYYAAVLPAILATPVSPVQLTFRGRPVSILFSHECTNSRRVASELALSQFHCRTCARRAAALTSLSDGSGVPVFLPPSVLAALPPDLPDRDLYARMAAVSAEAATSPITGVEVLTSRAVLNLPARPDRTVPYQHFAVESCDKVALATNADARALTLGCHRYLPDLLPRLVTSLTAAGTDGALASLRLMDSCLRRSTYGDKALPCVNWLTRVVEDVKAQGVPFPALPEHRRWAACANYLCWAGLARDAGDTVVCGLYHQANTNVLDLLATATSEAAMVAMLTDRFNPTTYRRPTSLAAMSETAVRAAMTVLGDFTNTVMTRSEVAALKQCVTVGGTPPPPSPTGVVAAVSSSMGALADMLANVRGGKKAGAGAFAARCGGAPAELVGMTSVKGLVAYLRAHPAASLTVTVSAACVAMYVAKTTLADGVVRVPHLWAFLQRRPEGVAVDATVRVTHVLPMYEYITEYQSVLFVADVPRPATLSNCCFPEFLSSEHSRVLRRPFEAMNTAVPVALPPGPLAYGVGFSATNRDGTLHTPVTMCVDGHTVHLTTL